MVKTQFPTSDGTIPDMVIFKGRDPVCVVEVKIGAPIGERQLERQGAWLRESAPDGCEPALVLLTQSTDAPEGFTSPGTGRYGVRLRSVASWLAVADWFGELAVEDGVAEPLKSLAREFSEFLKEDTMPTLDDAAIARLYLTQSHQQLRRCCAEHAGRLPIPARLDCWSCDDLSSDRSLEIGDRPGDTITIALCTTDSASIPSNEDDVGALWLLERYENDSFDNPRTDGYRGWVLCVRMYIR